MTQTKPLNEIFELAKGKKVNIINKKTEKSVPYLLIDTIRGKEPEFFTEDEKITEANEKDILMVFDGANSGLVGTGLRGAVGSTIARLRLKKDMNTKYITYFLSFNFSNLNQDMKGTAIPHVKPKKLLELNIRYPSISEQSLIVSAIETQFTRLDEAVKSLKLVKDKLKIYRKAVLAKSFYGEKKTLPQIVSPDRHSIKRGPFGGSLKKEIFVSRGYKIYEQQHAINNDFNRGRYFIIKEKFEEMKAFAIKPGDFIISCSGTIGKIAEVPSNTEEGIINQALLKITLDNSKIINKYFKYVFESEIIQRHLTKVSRGVAIKNVPSVKELKEIKFPVPSIEEQKEIILKIESKFSIIDKVEGVVNQALLKAEKLRKSILKSAFEGKLVKMEEVKNE